MEILGIGPSELIFIVIIALIVLGPKDMQKAGKTIGRWLNQLVRSDGWKAFQRTTSEIRNLPTNLMREANAELRETEKEIRRNIGPSPFIYPTQSKPASISTGSLPPSEGVENTIQPSAANTTPQVAPESNPTTADSDASLNNQDA